jgi:hypothetical protein
MNRIHLVQDRDKRQAAVEKQWTFRFHTMHGIYWLAVELLAYQQGLCSRSWLFSQSVC